MPLGPLAQARGSDRESFAQHSEGLLLIANGIDPVLRWDGLTVLAEQAGVAPPTQAVTLGSSGSGSITGTYYAYERFLDRYGNPSNLSPIAAAISVSGAAQIDYANVQAPPVGGKVVSRQILRNSAGQTLVFYVDVETTDLTSTTFSSTSTDTDLTAQTAVTLLDPDSRPLANLHGVPPNDRSVLAAHLDRMFAGGENVVSVGSVAVVSGSATVTGAGTDWRDTLAGRFLWVAGATQPYEIASVSAALQTLTLVDAYADASNPYALYAIRPALPRRRLVQFSEAGQPESWPATNAVSVQEDSDEITALMPMGSFLYVVCRRHTYRLTFQEDPLKDGFVFPAHTRGCVNDRCWVLAGGDAYLLDEQGCYVMTSGGETQEISPVVQDLFETGPMPGGTQTRLRIQWRAARHFHAVWEPVSRVVRWFVTLAGAGHPRHALCFDTVRRGWWVEEYHFPVASSAEFTFAGSPRVALGGPAGQLLLQGEGTLDLADAQAGTVRGAVSSASPLGLTDGSAAFSPSCVGSPVTIVDGAGRGQTRTVVSAVGDALAIDRPWTQTPDSTSIYQAGGVSWRYRTGWFRFADDEDENPRRVEVIFQPCASACLMDARLYYDRSTDPVVWATSYSTEQAAGFSSTGDSPDLVADLSKPIGLVQRRLDGHKEHYLDGPRYVQVELAGVSNEDLVTIYGVTIDGVSS